MASDLSVAADDLLLTARAYHLGVRDGSIEIRIKMTLQDMAMKAVSLADVCDDQQALQGCRSAIGAMRRAITASHFEDEHDGPLAGDDRILEGIASAVVRVKLALLRLKHGQLALP